MTHAGQLAAAEGTGPDLFVEWSRGQPGTTLRRRLRDSLRDAIRTGRLPPGARLPSSRALAADLGVSRGVVLDAYAQLGAEGFVVTQQGSGTVVADTGRTNSGYAGTARVPTAVFPETVDGIDLRPGPPDLATFPRTTWLKTTKDVLRTTASADLGYMPPWGVDVLRAELTEYLSRVRGVMTDSGAVLVVSGATQGITLLVRVLRAAGVGDIAVEAPSNPVQRQVLGRYGVRVWDVPVDEEGLVVDALAQTPCQAVVVTPGHQYPCGMVMSAARRGALTRWAERVSGVVIEDDYDAVFRHDKMQVGALQALSPTRVALVGSVSKSLAPGLRLGWVVCPPHLVADVRAAKRDDDFGTSVIEQYTLARLIATGDYDRHVRRLRRHYRARRDTVLTALRRQIPDVVAEGYAAGLHLLVRLPPDVDEELFVSAAGAHGVAVLGTSPMYGTLPARPGVVLGYGRVSPAVLEDAVRRLADAVRAVRTAAPHTGSTRDGRSRTRVRPSTAVDYFAAPSQAAGRP